MKIAIAVKIFLHDIFEFSQWTEMYFDKKVFHNIDKAST